MHPKMLLLLDIMTLVVILVQILFLENFCPLTSLEVLGPMDPMQNYSKLFKIINFKGAGGPMFKTCQCVPYIAVMTISEFEPHSRFHS